MAAHIEAAVAHLGRVSKLIEILRLLRRQLTIVCVRNPD
jgi:hypothetical protein